MTEPATYIHGHHDSVLRSHRWRTVENSAAYLAPRLRPGILLLDVGCGPGTITAELADLVAPGEVTGIDRAGGVLDEARAAMGDRVNVTIMEDDVMALSAPDDHFDVVHAHQVFQHLPDPVGALREVARVCRADGLIALRDVVYESMTWFPESPGLTRWLELYLEVARSTGGSPDAGRRLRSWVREAGCTEVDAGADTWAYTSEADRQWWGSLWADRVVSSSFATEALRLGLADRSELDELSVAWREWAEAEDGWFAMLHGWILARPGS